MVRQVSQVRPTRADLLAAANRTVRDVIAPGLRVLFAGINPGLYTAWAGHHFARPGNRFWPTLHAAGFTDRVLDPSEEHALLPLGFGITNVVQRASALASELSAAELEVGGMRLVRTVKRYRPRCLAVLGVSAYRGAFRQPRAIIGRQDDAIGETTVWVLPNPSGLNAHYQLPELARLFRQLRESCCRGCQSAR
ncbi:MAG TPA: G/U mismatch-specific DNA glycosylase [Gemmatimonadaceae bacterium]|nr:G/U mismatch-specific DNA glycosylase [Gemmatimonadaceae bacterium]